MISIIETPLTNSIHRLPINVKSFAQMMDV